MRRLSALTALGASMLLLSLPVRGATRECPASDFDKIVEMLRSAPSCRESLALFEACSYAASGDVALGAAVVERCEADFLTRLSAPQRRTYDREQKRCARKYRSEAGTMYRSFEAFCGAKLARSYAARFATPRPDAKGR